MIMLFILLIIIDASGLLAFGQDALIKNGHRIFLVLVSLFELELYDPLCSHKNVRCRTNPSSRQTLSLIIRKPCSSAQILRKSSHISHDVNTFPEYKDAGSLS